MDDRLILIQRIVEHGSNSLKAKNELSNFTWDYNGDEFKLNQSHIRNILESFLIDKISAEELEEWAEFIECREGIDYRDYADMIFSLANPKINGEISETSVRKLLNQL